MPQMTVGWWHPRFVPRDDYSNVVRLFEWSWMYPLYSAALVALGLHLFHGTWSVLRTLGLAAPSVDPQRRPGATLLACGVTVGFRSIMLAVAAGMLRAS